MDGTGEGGRASSILAGGEVILMVVVKVEAVGFMVDAASVGLPNGSSKRSDDCGESW